MHSMTGFGTSQESKEGITLNIQVKSVNARFLETKFRMPREYASLENELKKLLSKKILRGTVDVFIMKSADDESTLQPVKFNSTLAKAWVQSAKELAGDLQMAADMSLETVMRFPDVIQQKEYELKKGERDFLFDVFEGAVDDCLKVRKAEGQALFNILSDLLNGLEDSISQIQKKKEGFDLTLEERLKSRVEQIQKDFSIDPQRLTQEILFILDRADIAEEMTRTLAHIGAFRQILKNQGPIGKKLEFYTQELHREVNTIGSKTQDFGIAVDMIEAKTIVERLREQVQNVE